MKIFNKVLPILFLGIFGFIYIINLSPEKYYNGEPLTSLNVVLKSKPQYYFDGVNHVSYYYFITNTYNSHFRLQHGGLDIARSSKLLINSLENIDVGDTVNISIESVDTGKLHSENIIQVIGFIYNGIKLIKPADVKKMNKKNYDDSLFGHFVILIITIIILVRQYFKSKKIQQPL